MNIKSREKHWGVEVEINFDNSILKADVHKSECDGLISDMIQVQRDLCSFKDVGDAEFVKRVIDTFGLSGDSMCEVSNYLEDLMK